MSVFQGEVFGGAKLIKQLEAIDKDVRKEIEDALALGVLAIHGEAIRSIQKHMSKGIKYGNHTASSPGNPPNTDTGMLVKSIDFDIDRQNLSGIVGSNLPYAAALEFGTSKMEARPWLSRAFNVKAKMVVDMFNKALKKGLK